MSRLPAPANRRKKPQYLLHLSGPSRKNGVHIMAGKGSGKSRLMGRFMGYQDFRNDIPTVIFDPHGSTIDNVIDKISRVWAGQSYIWDRVVYVDFSAPAKRVVPFPLYYRLGDESLEQVAGRFLHVARTLDPNLQGASIEGWNALKEIGTDVGIVLAALGMQITEVPSLLADPASWAPRLRALAQDRPDAAYSVNALLNTYARLKPPERSRKSGSFEAKASLFQRDPTMRAMFGADVPGIDWAEVVDKRQLVLLDFRGVQDPDRRQFTMMWAYSYLYSFLKHRGQGRHTPISVIIDELTALTNFEVDGQSLFAKEIDELINQIARQYSVWLTIAHQELFQLSRQMQQTLMAMGTQIMGKTSDRETALALAEQFFPLDPMRVKTHEPVWMSDPLLGPFIVDERPLYLTPVEQQFVASDHFLQMKLFDFLVRPATGEGNVSNRIFSTSVAGFDEDEWVDQEFVNAARRRLFLRSSQSIQPILDQISSRSGAKTTPQTRAASDTIDPDDFGDTK